MKTENKTLYVYGEIGQSGLLAKKFIDDLSNADDRPVDVRINSGGGEVFDGLVIHNAIKNYQGNTIAHIDGVVGGIASIIAFAANEVWMKADALLMICEATVFGVGLDEAQTQDEKTVLDKANNSLINIYAPVFKKTNQEIREMMESETWFTAQEAMDMGIITGIY